MFTGLGKLVSRCWPVSLVVWGLVLALAFWVAPPWEDVVLDREFAFLPSYVTSQKGQEAFKKAFPRQFNPSSLVLVLSRPDGELRPEDNKFVAQDLHPGLKEIEKQEGGPAHHGSAAEGDASS